MEVRIGPADVGSRVVVRWRRPTADGGEEIADVLGALEAADAEALAVRRDSGEVVTIPLNRALAGKPVPPKPTRSASRQTPPRR
jgi:hypothetical protein